jgi:hypothetical protein
MDMVISPEVGAGRVYALRLRRYFGSANLRRSMSRRKLVLITSLEFIGGSAGLAIILFLAYRSLRFVLLLLLFAIGARMSNAARKS